MKSTVYKSRLAAIGTLLALGVHCFLPSVHAASAECKPSWGWSYNSNAQNPCQVAASLQGPCFGQPNFELQPLKPGNLYVNPKRKTPLRKRCGCNTVIFSLFMACTLCQNSTKTRTWSGWSEFCDNVYVTQYPFDIPQGAMVPHWAYLDYTKENKFNPTFAESVGRDPEVTPTASSATSAPPTATGPPSGSDQEGGTTRNVGAIAGGVIGGVAGLLAIAALVLYFLRKRRRRTQEAHLIDLDLATGGQWETTATENSHKIHRLYDPSDPSTFPDSAPDLGEGYMSSRADITPLNHGRYTGNAEI